MVRNPLIVNFLDAYNADEELVGKKGHELGALWKLGVPLPKGFVITTEFFKEFLRLAEIDKKTYKSPVLKHPALSHTTDNLFKKQIMHNHIPQELASELHHYYKQISGLFKNKPLNIFSSSSNNKSITYCNIKGDANLILKIKAIWSQSFKKPVAIIAQESIQSEIKGKTATNNPILDIKLKKHQMDALIGYCKIIQRHFYFPKIIEYKVNKGIMMVTNVYPFTGTANKIQKEAPHYVKLKKLLIKGISINPGIVTGKIKILHNKHEKVKIGKGEIVALPNLDYLTFGEMQNANAIIVDSVLPNSLGKALFRKKFHFPAIEGTKNATKILKNGNIITVNGINGEIYSGGLL